ncbi:MAG TPA: alpha-amylase family glycosyl hydrolase, partial [Tepidiformaceae bacterium]|nr:alpha-amylase family glycosyl hydrolase [Tepidiformaceae bacterium]
MVTRSQRRYGTPLATYRLQLTPEFGFAEALDVVPYLEKLGVSHLYLSPFFEAAPGSTHGYDVVNHNQVRRAFGGLSGLYELGEGLASRDMGLIADFVPNHVGIGTANPWWIDVLRYGRESPYAAYFDIDWEAQPQMTSGMLRYPVLGQSFGRALEAGELRLALIDHDLVVTYYDYHLPLSPHSYSRVLGIPPIALRDRLGDPAALAKLVETIDGLRQASRDEADPMLTTFRSLLAGEPPLAAWAEETVERLNGSNGDPASFDALEAVLLEQPYRLTDWRVSGEEINYRRFFDNNDLAGIRVERDDVFEDIHRLLFELVAGGIVTGVRIDHVDGLYDPGSYLARLRQRLDEITSGLEGSVVPIYVEKILERSEQLPSWAMDGTTGYNFLGEVEGLFVDRTAAGPMTAAYRDFTGVRQRFDDVVYDSKLHIAATAFAGEMNVLAWQLYRIAERHRLYRDITLRAFRRAITGVMACFPVYRTYLADDPGDAAGVIDRANAD